MSKLVILLCLAAVVSSNMVIKCYKCQGLECEKTKDHWGKISCGTFASSEKNRPVCLTQLITDNGHKRVDRRCIIATIKDNKPFHQCSQNQETCEICETDLCNFNTIVNSQDDCDSIKIKNLFIQLQNWRQTHSS